MSFGRWKLAASSLCWLTLVLCQIGSVAALERLQASAEGVVDEARLREELATAVQQNPDLRGSWAKVIVEQDKSLRVVLVVDSAPAVGTRQEKILRELVRKIAGRDFDNFGETEKLPVGSLLAKIVTQSEDDPRLAGVRILDAHFYPREGLAGQLFLKLNGSISNLDQAEILRTLCNEKLVPLVMGTETSSPSIVVDTDPATSTGESNVGLVVRPLSSIAASMSFVTGMDAFVQQDYNKALAYLTYAGQDDPRRDEIKYWRVAALIALDQHDRARDIVRKLTPPNRSKVPYFSSHVLSSLERINGPVRTPIRQQLDAMVREAISGHSS